MEGENCKCIETKMKNDMAIILEKYTTDKDNLIQILNEIQEKFGYIPKIAQMEISKYLNISMAEIYGVITFYSRFTLEPKGKYAISVCLGTACFVKGSEQILNRLKDKYRRKLAEADIDDNTRYELLQRLEGTKNHDKLCHGDFNPSNVIIKDNGEYHIIDWAHATQGNASADVAKTFLLFSVNGQAELAEKYLNMITEKGGLEKRGIQRWIPIVAAVQLKKGEVEDRKTLEKWVDVVDYE